jgi:hypothetical protein
MKTVSEVLNAAADLLEKDGWCQDVLKDREGRCCARGALIAVHAADDWQGPVYDADELLEEAVGGSIPAWNDLPNQTGENVIATLRHTAKENE